MGVGWRATIPCNPHTAAWVDSTVIMAHMDKQCWHLLVTLAGYASFEAYIFKPVSALPNLLHWYGKRATIWYNSCGAAWMGFRVIALAYINLCVCWLYMCDCNKTCWQLKKSEDVLCNTLLRMCLKKLTPVLINCL